MVDETRPVLVGYGPVEASTSLALEPWPSIIWDTNLYYRDLGVHPKASRKEIGLAYQYHMYNRGDSNRLTMIVSTLINEKLRLSYDLIPFGSFFFDIEIEESIRRDITERASQETMRTGRVIDGDALVEEIERTIAPTGRIEPHQGRGLWSYYVWSTKCYDMDRLSEWRRLLVDQLNGIVPQIAVGFKGGGQPLSIAQVGQRVVAFIGDKTDPTEVLAASAASLIKSKYT